MQPILLEMVKHWLSITDSFRLMQYFVPLNIVDICMCLRLGIVGVDVPFDRNVCGVVSSLFTTKLIVFEDVIHMMGCIIESEVDDVDNVYRLYIFVCFAVPYFPRNSKSVCNIPSNVVEDIDDLSKYNWAKVVLRYLVNNLSRAFLAPGQQEICLSKLAVVLQVIICICYVQIFTSFYL